MCENEQQQFLVMLEAVVEVELKKRNTKGLIAELDTIETPMIACKQV